MKICTLVKQQVQNTSTTVDVWRQMHYKDGECSLVQIPNRNSNILRQKKLQIYRIYTNNLIDCWKDYNSEKFEKVSYNPFTVYHKCNFPDPRLGVHKNIII